MKPADLVRKVILTEMVTLYRSPSQVQNAEQGAVYQTAIIETLAQFRPTEPELTSMWEKFKRRWTKTIWPTPGELCQALSTERGKAPRQQPRTLDPPTHVTTAAEQADFNAAVSRVRAKPDQFINAPALLRMAEHFERQ